MICSCGGGSWGSTAIMRMGTMLWQMRCLPQAWPKSWPGSQMQRPGHGMTTPVSPSRCRAHDVQGSRHNVA
eukprot:12114718-Heterocapsa_arctica.AAC.1